jgi:histidine triad (HIT) family protein
MSDCLFCKIVAGDIPAAIVAESENVIAFRDIAPKAPLHVLVVPRTHVANVTEAAAQIPAVLAEMVALAQQVADTEADGTYRLVFNTGENAGQSVFHVHGHVLGGKALEWENV